VNGPQGSLAARGLLIETSALVAIALEEVDWQGLANRIATTSSKTCAFNIFEASLAVASRKALAVSKAYAQVVAIVEEFAIEIVPFTPEMLPHAVAARERYGRGRKGLNMGDCLSYAAAKQLGLTLLYKGDDFARTDVNG
jgi:ribonuclease VapC